MTDHSLIQVTRQERGHTKTWVGDYPSKAEARAEAARIRDEDDADAVLVVVPAERWHNGEAFGEVARLAGIQPPPEETP